MEAMQEFFHENCRLNHNYLIEVGGITYQAKFKGYPDHNQYKPAFEIVGEAGGVKVLQELD